MGSAPNAIPTCSGVDEVVVFTLLWLMGGDTSPGRWACGNNDMCPPELVFVVVDDDAVAVEDEGAGTGAGTRCEISRGRIPGTVW